MVLGQALVRLSRHLFMTGRHREAEARDRSAPVLPQPTGAPGARLRVAYEGAVLALTVGR